MEERYSLNVVMITAVLNFAQALNEAFLSETFLYRMGVNVYFFDDKIKLQEGPCENGGDAHYLLNVSQKFSRVEYLII